MGGHWAAQQKVRALAICDGQLSAHCQAILHVSLIYGASCSNRGALIAFAIAAQQQKRLHSGVTQNLALFFAATPSRSIFSDHPDTGNHCEDLEPSGRCSCEALAELSPMLGDQLTRLTASVQGEQT